MKTNVDWYHQPLHNTATLVFTNPPSQVGLGKESFKFKSKSPDSVTRLNAWEEIPLSIAGMLEISQQWPALSRDTRPGPGILTTKADFYCSRAWNYSTVNLQAGTPFNSKLLALIYDESWSRKERMFCRYNYHLQRRGECNQTVSNNKEMTHTIFGWNGKWRANMMSLNFGRWKEFSFEDIFWKGGTIIQSYEQNALLKTQQVHSLPSREDNEYRNYRSLVICNYIFDIIYSC